MSVKLYKGNGETTMKFKVVVAGSSKPLESEPMAREQAFTVRDRMTAKGYLAMVVPVLPRVAS